MDDIKKMLGKKDKSEDPMKKEAKLSALKGLRDEMSEMMRGDLGGRMNKVTVAAPDKEGLEKGLEKAKEVMKQMPESEEIEESPEHEASESPEMEASEHEELSAEEIDEMMKKLMEMKEKISKK